MCCPNTRCGRHACLCYVWGYPGEGAGSYCYDEYIKLEAFARVSYMLVVCGCMHEVTEMSCVSVSLRPIWSDNQSRNYKRRGSYCLRRVQEDSTGRTVSVRRLLSSNQHCFPKPILNSSKKNETWSPQQAEDLKFNFQPRNSRISGVGADSESGTKGCLFALRTSWGEAAT